ncbi:MAG: type I-C CRISPR-associated protein Cas7/Csd2 [Puniceicoccales bacterium]|jgi:CRISPR-associated protein Csd2|nr:type I-C CRISPR-associated protein Cas7/Csd2 [Puniceicoccales bacterium]
MSNTQDTKDVLNNRHDFLLLFEVTNGNPNGDPDAGNMPRLDPNTNRGIVTDVCLKRKVRNFVELKNLAEQGAEANGIPGATPVLSSEEKEKLYNPAANQIFIQQGAILNNRIDQAEAFANAAQSRDKQDEWEHAALKWLCSRYFDLRAFGMVLSTGNKIFKGSAWGQVRGPVQFTFGQSAHPITPLEVSITRCAVTNAADGAAGAGNNRTMGNKHIVPYALYVAKGYVSPSFAARTGFTQADLDLLFEALLHMFEHDRSAARGEMVVRGLYDFEHVGTQPGTNSAQNKREAQLGCAHAHELFEGIKVSLKEGREFPESFADYEIENTWTSENLPKGVQLRQRHLHSAPLVVGKKNAA